MQFLEKTTKSYQIVLSGAETTNKLTWESSWELHSPGAPSGPSDTPMSQGGLSNGTTAVQVVPPPPSGTQQCRLRNFTMSNQDTAPATVSWQKTDSATNTTRTLMVVTLQTNETLVFDENGWNKYDASGNLSVTNTTVTNTAQSVAVSGGIVASTAQSTATSAGQANSEAVSAGLATSVGQSTATSGGLSTSVAQSGAVSGGLATSVSQSAAVSGGLAVSSSTSAGLATSVALSTGVSQGTASSQAQSVALSTGLVASKAQSAITSGNV